MKKVLITLTIMKINKKSGQVDSYFEGSKKGHHAASQEMMPKDLQHAAAPNKTCEKCL